jgi:ankyrin repeat protein
MKYLVTAIAALVLVGCGESKESASSSELKPNAPVAGSKAPDISINDAALFGDIEAIKQHLAAGTDVENKDPFGLTPLSLAKNKEIIKLLINAGAEVNYAPENGITSLANAVLRKDKESAKLLISSGANVNSIDREGSTPLNTAIFCMEMLKVDEEIGLNANDIAASRVTLTEIIKLLRKHGGKMAEELKAAGN